MIERRFGESQPYSLGVEEELMLLDAETLVPAPVAQAAIADAEGRDLPGALKPELFAAVLESNTPVSSSAPEVERCLAAMRHVAAELAGAHGAVLAAFGAHPFCPSAQQVLSDDERATGR